MNSKLSYCYFIDISVPNNTDDETTGSIQFVENYTLRFGEPHPTFFTGSLDDAIREACHKPAREVSCLVYVNNNKYFYFNFYLLAA